MVTDCRSKKNQPWPHSCISPPTANSHNPSLTSAQKTSIHLGAVYFNFSLGLVASNLLGNSSENKNTSYINVSVCPRLLFTYRFYTHKNTPEKQTVRKNAYLTHSRFPIWSILIYFIMPSSAGHSLLTGCNLWFENHSSRFLTHVNSYKVSSRSSHTVATSTRKHLPGPTELSLCTYHFKQECAHFSHL